MTGEHPASAEQLQLLHAAAAPRRSARSERDTAVVDPVARVLVDVGLAHLDRPFEYSVPASMSDDCRPGVRVRVRFAGKDHAGFVLERAAAAQHAGQLAEVRRVVSPEPVLAPQLTRVARAVADRYAGTMSDVLRLAIPPRHAAAEHALDRVTPSPDAAERLRERAAGVPPAAWEGYAAGPALLARLRSGQAPWASWLARPGADADASWPAALAQAAAAALAGGRGCVLVVPDHRDVDRVAAQLTELIGVDGFVRLTADQGPRARYTAWLKVLRDQVRCVIGTRAAAFAPVHHLGLVAWWDDGDDLLSEPRAPYPHVREVLRLRAELEGAGLLVGGYARSTRVQAWLESGLVRAVEPAVTRRMLPRVTVAGDEWEVARNGPAAYARLPPTAWRAAHAGLSDGPVLVQVPRRGYRPSLQCRTCRAPVRCERCHGPVQQSSSGSTPACRWCATPLTQFSCAECGDRRLRAATVGTARTADELGRAFPGVPVVRSGADEVVAQVGCSPALVIATPGAEPLAEGGYAATLLLDGWALLDRPTLDAGEEALRRWMAAVALTRPADRGGAVVLCSAPASHPAAQALVRWAPEWFAARELAERRALGLPPAAWMALVTGEQADVTQAASLVTGPVERIGPLAGPSGGRDGIPASRMLLRAAWTGRVQVTQQLAAIRAGRSARKASGAVTVRVDPEGSLL